MDKNTSPEHVPSLTEREQQVLGLIAAGLSNRAIAEQLVLSNHTVAWYVQQIFSKLNVNRRTQAVAVARSLGILDGHSTPTPKPVLRDRPLHNLPTQPTSFIGRKDEIDEIQHMLSDANCRLLTLVGPGGVGKTRLALEVATHQLDEFDDGVYFIALQPLSSSEDMIPTIASSIGIQLQPGQRAPVEQIVDYLREKSLLLVMDNLEHLLDGVSLISSLLSAVSGLRVLATSRESLNLREEHLYNVSGLQFPGDTGITIADGFSAIQLFTERANQIYPSFSPESKLPAIVRICQCVDGIPLALELAVSWLKTLSCEEIVTEIERGIDILATPLRNVPERHRSMQAVFEYSWQLLSETEQMIFRRLSVFRGGCTRVAAQVVAGADLPVLQALADKSFIRRDPASGRYTIHELLRQYGEEHLHQTSESVDAIYDLHCTYYADLLGQHRESVSNHRQREMMQELEPELDNIRASWRWAVDHTRVDAIQNALHTFAYFHIFRSRFLEEADALKAAIQSLDVNDPDRQEGIVLAALLSYCGWIYVRIGEYEQAQTMFQQSRMLYQHFNAPAPPGWASEPLTGLTLLASIQGNYIEAEHFGEQAYAASEVNGDQWNRQLALYGLTSTCFHQGKYAEARQYAEQAFAISNESGDQWFRAIILNDLGNIARVQGHYSEAREHFRTSLAIRRTFDDSQGIAAALNYLGQIAVLEGNYADADQLYHESHTLYKEISDRGGTGYTLCGRGTVALKLGQFQQARRYFYDALLIARDIQYAPFTFSVLIGVSQLLLRADQFERIIELLALSVNHPLSDQEAKDRAQQLFTGIQHELESKVQRAAWERGRVMNLETVVQELLDTFDPAM